MKQCVYKLFLSTGNGEFLAHCNRDDYYKRLCRQYIIVLLYITFNCQV